MPPVLGEALGNLSDDDYVAQVLAKEARDNSAKYAAQGLGAYMPKRPTTGAPKPNTRFLRNIIRSTDSHNASLRRKEEREARERKRLLQDRSSSHPHASRRHDLHSDELESKRRRREGREDRHRHSHRRRHRSRSISAERDESRRRRRRSRPDDIDDDRSHRSSRGDRRHDRDERYRSRRRRSSSRSRSRSPRDRRRRGSRRHRHERSSHRSASSRSRSRSRSPQRSKSHRVKDDDGWQKRQRSRERLHRREERTPSPPENPQNKYLGEESDPLEDLVGPLPPNMNGLDAAAMRSRGRGAYKTAASNIDDHFAPDYDPTLDVHPKDDDASNTLDRPTRRPVPGLMDGEDDWDLALEALRDRVRWRQKGEERLREAGFNEDVVERWKNDAAFTNSGETEEVKWSKKGEGREWDRGKVVGEDGHVDVKAPW